MSSALISLFPEKDRLTTVFHELVNDNDKLKDVKWLFLKALSAYYNSDYAQCRETCVNVIDYTWELLNTGHWKDVPVSARYLYSFGTLVKVMARVQLQETQPQALIRDCDMGLLLGAPIFENVLAKFATVLNASAKFGLEHEEERRCFKKQKIVEYPKLTADRMVTEEACPAIFSFKEKYMDSQRPVVILDCISYWPALSTNKWNIEYLRRVAGSRTVPVELGSKYTDDSWSQELMTLSDFISRYIENINDGSIGYVAQHELFEQIPELRHDIDIPTYCCLGENDDVDINAWFGPAETVSPLHYDPKHNFLAQVTGEKYIRLYDEKYTSQLYPYEVGMLQNTSQVDVGNPDLTKFPEFLDVPYQECILKSGQMLYIPPKCWHYVKSLSLSFSVSFWWN